MAQGLLVYIGMSKPTKTFISTRVEPLYLVYLVIVILTLFTVAEILTVYLIYYLTFIFVNKMVNVGLQITVAYIPNVVRVQNICMQT